MSLAGCSRGCWQCGELWLPWQSAHRCGLKLLYTKSMSDVFAFGSVKHSVMCFQPCANRHIHRSAGQGAVCRFCTSRAAAPGGLERRCTADTGGAQLSALVCKLLIYMYSCTFLRLASLQAWSRDRPILPPCCAATGRGRGSAGSCAAGSGISGAGHAQGVHAGRVRPQPGGAAAGLLKAPNPLGSCPAGHASCMTYTHSDQHA